MTLEQIKDEGLPAYKVLNSFHLKLIAIITMLIDHFAAVFIAGSSPWYIVFRGIGRLSFPIFAFLIVEGFHYTKNEYKYLARLGIFAVISEIPFDLAFSKRFFDFENQNIYFTLFLGLLLLILLEKIDKAYLHNPMLQNIYSTITILVVASGAMILKTDYTFIGIFIILGFYYFRFKYIKSSLFLFIIQFFTLGPLQALGTFSMIPIVLYSGAQGRKVKYLFYSFYPIHLLILYLIFIL